MMYRAFGASDPLASINPFKTDDGYVSDPVRPGAYQPDPGKVRATYTDPVRPWHPQVGGGRFRGRRQPQDNAQAAYRRPVVDYYGQRPPRP